MYWALLSACLRVARTVAGGARAVREVGFVAVFESRVLSAAPACGAEHNLCQICAAYTAESGERLLSVYLLERFADDNLVSRFDAPPFVQCSGTVFDE